MRALLKFAAAALFVAALLVPAPRVSRAQSTAIAVIVHPEIAIDRLSATELAAIFTGSMRTWPDGKPLVAFNAPPRSPLRVLFDEIVLRMTPDQAGRFWIDTQIRGNGRPPRQVPDPNMSVRLIPKVPGAIGYVPSHLVNASVKVVARIDQGKVLPP